MTAGLDRISSPGPRWARHPPVADEIDGTGQSVSDRKLAGGAAGGWLTRHPAWPITALLAGYPLWWALGVGDFIWIFLAAPMAVRMWSWHAHGSRRLRMPPGFAIWLLFLVWSVAGVVMLTANSPGTVPTPVGHRLLSYGNRNLSYLGLTILLLYAGNLTEKELPRRKLAWLLGLVGLYTLAGGFGGMLLPHLQFSSPAQLLLPRSLQSNAFFQASMHPGLAQVQAVFDSGAQGRPKAPFDYTNTWGECLSITLPWLLVACSAGGTRRRRLLCWAAAVIALIPLIYSLNRGVWLGVGLAVIYIGVRLAARGRLAVLGGICAATAAVAILVAVSPLQSVFTQRLQHGRSNDLRAGLTTLAIEGGRASPVIGYGDTRQQRGSTSSIAVGPSPKCPICGQQAVGSNGQLWLLLVCNGFLGAAIYLAFFGFGIVRYRRDLTGYGMVGVLVLIESFLYLFFYDAVPAPLGFTMLAYALLWRNDQQLSAVGGSLPTGTGSRL